MEIKFNMRHPFFVSNFLFKLKLLKNVKCPKIWKKCFARIFCAKFVYSIFVSDVNMLG